MFFSFLIFESSFLISIHFSIQSLSNILESKLKLELKAALPALSRAGDLYNRFYEDVGRMLATMEMMRRFVMIPGADYLCFNFFYGTQTGRYPVKLVTLEKELPHIVKKIMKDRASIMEKAEVDEML